MMSPDLLAKRFVSGEMEDVVEQSSQVVSRPRKQATENSWPPGDGRLSGNFTNSYVLIVIATVNGHLAVLLNTHRRFREKQLTHLSKVTYNSSSPHLHVRSREIPGAFLSPI